MQVRKKMWGRRPNAAIAFQLGLWRGVVFGVLAIFLANAGATAQQPANAPPPSEHRPPVVFLGDSITYFWGEKRPSFFTENNYIDQGVSGQTTAVLLIRVSRDVLPL